MLIDELIEALVVLGESDEGDPPYRAVFNQDGSGGILNSYDDMVATWVDEEELDILIERILISDEEIEEEDYEDY